MNNVKLITLAIIIALSASGLSLYKAFNKNTLSGFDDPGNFAIQDIPIKLAVYLIDKNLKLATVNIEQLQDRMTVVAALQKIIIEKQEVQGIAINDTEERMTAEENK